MTRTRLSRISRLTAAIAFVLVFMTALDPHAARAGQVSLAANAERSVAAAFSPVSCPGAPNRWKCLDEFSGSGDDYFSTTSSATSSFELSTTTIPSPVVTSVALHLVMTTTVASACTVTLRLRKSDGTLVAQYSADPGGPGFFHHMSASLGPLSLNQTDVDGLYEEIAVSVTSGTCSVQQAYTDIIWPDTITLSGTADNTSICDGVTPVIGIALNSTKNAKIPCTSGSGTYHSATAFGAGVTITSYYDDVAGGSANAGATWVKTAASSATPISGVPLTRTRYRTEARSAGVAITGIDVAKYDSGDDTDIKMSAAGALTSSDTGATLEIGVNTFQPGMTVSVYKVWVRTGATYDAQATALAINGTGIGACDNTAPAIPFCVMGTFSAGTGHVYFYGAPGNTSIPGGTFNALTIQGSSSVFVLGATGTPTTLTAASLNIASSGAAVVATTSGLMTDITVTGNVSVGASTTLSGASATNWTIRGDLAGAGTVNLTGGTVDLRGAGFVSINNTSVAWQFASLTVSATTGNHQVTMPGTAREIRISNTFSIGRSSDTMVGTFTATMATQPVTITGDLHVTNRGSFVSPPNVSLAGDALFEGTYTPNFSTMSIAGSGTSTLTTLGGTGGLYRLSVTVPGKVVAFAGTLSISNGLTATGTSCASPVYLQSYLSGTMSALTVPAAGHSISYAAVRDLGTSNVISTTNSINRGGNINIGFPIGSGCGPMVPMADRSKTGAITTAGAAPCAAATLWNCADDSSASGASDADYFIGPVGASQVAFDLTSVTVPGVAHSVVISMRAMAAALPCTASLTLRRAAGTVVATNTFALTTGVANYRFEQAGLTLTQTDVDGLYIDVTMGSGGCTGLTYVSTVNVDLLQSVATVTGTADNLAICDGVTPVIGVAVNNTKFGKVACAPTTGFYYAGPVFNAGDTLAVYYDDVAGGIANTGAVHVKAAAASTTPVTSVNLKRRYYQIEARAPGTPITDVDLSQWERTSDPDIWLDHEGYRVVQGDPGGQVEIRVGTFRPSVDIVVPQVWVRTGATYDAQATSLTVSNPGDDGCDNTATYIPFCVMGTFLPGTGTVTYTGLTDVVVATANFNNLVLEGDGTNFQFGQFGVGSSTISMNSLVIGTRGAPVTAFAEAFTTAVNVSGPTTINAGATLQGSSSATWTIGGTFSGSGNVNLTGGTVDLRSNGTAQTLNASGTLPGTAWQFATLIASTSGAARTVTVPATSREIRTSALMQIGKSADAATTTLDATALTRPITASDDFTITARGHFRPPPWTNTTVRVDGNFHNTGSFTHGNSNIEFAGSGTTVLTTTGEWFYRLTVTTPGKVVELAADIAVNNQLTMTGTSCSDPVVLRTTVPGVKYTLYVLFTTVQFDYVSIRDMNTNQTKAATNAADMGNNTGITFGAVSDCGTISTLHTHNTNASTGAVRPTDIDGRTAFRMSAANQTGDTVDRFRTEITSSALDSSVKALFALDGSGADRSPVNNTAVPSGGPTYVAGATNFGQTANFDGVDDMISAPSNAAYTSTTFTVDFWMRAPGFSPATNGALVARTGATDMQFAVYTNAASGELRGAITAGGVSFITRTPAEPWLDNTWHHVAFTADSSKTLRLYVDGVQYGTPVVYTGTLDTGAWPLTLGGTGSPANYYQGLLDDVQFTAGAPDPAAIAGYAATKRPHAQSIWQSTGYGTAAGAALSSGCAVAARCADILYGGTNIREDGARYYATHRLRTSAGYWSAAASDWFQTSDSISVSAPGTVPLAAAAPGIDTTASFNVVTTCSNGGGCALQMSTPSQAVGMLDSTGANATSIPLYTTGAPTAWAAGAGLGLGFTVLSSTNAKNTTTWGTGTNFTNLALLKFTGAGRTPVVLHTMPSGSETTSVGVRLNAPSTQKLGSYSGTVSLVALDAP